MEVIQKLKMTTTCCSDILKLRDIARQNYIRYYVLENLMALKANQEEEKRLMDNVEEFQKVNNLILILTPSLFNRKV